jgi:multicomponent Na+:H+ antiporter subunit F
MNPENLASWFHPTNIVLAMLILALFLAFIRLAKGPTLPDRVVAFDVMTVAAAGILAVATITLDKSVFLDAAIVLALIAFLATVAFARYLERRSQGE